jgi:hypothetical protein
VSVGYGGEERLDLVALGDVCRHDRRVRARLREFGDQFLHALAVGAAAAGQEEVAYAVPGDEVPGDEAAQGAGAAGDQDRALRAEQLWDVRDLSGDSGEAGRGECRAAHRDLRLVTGEDRAEYGCGAVGGGRVGVDQDDPVGVLGLRGADQAPYGRSGRVGDHPVAGRDRAAGRHDEARLLEAVRGVPGLYDTQHPVGQGEYVVPGCLQECHRRDFGTRGENLDVVRSDDLRP